MKVINRKNPKIHDIYLNEPRITGNRVHYSWSKNPLLDEDVYWIEYPDLSEIMASTNELMAPYLPICIAFAVLGKVSVHLPYKLEEHLFQQWRKMIIQTAKVTYRKTSGFTLVNGSVPAQTQCWEGTITGSLFGGGSEALLTLAQEMDTNRPAIISLGGPRWGGSDPDQNPEKFALDAVVSDEFNLDLINVRTSFFKLIYEPDWDWRIHLRRNIHGLVSSSVMLPFLYTTLLPVAAQLGLRKVISGNESDNEYCITTYTFSDEMIQNVQNLSYQLSYESKLGDLTKTDIVHQLHKKYPQFGKHQYSCLSNTHERWCCSCVKCFRIFITMKCFDLDPSAIGLNEGRIIHNKEKISAAIQAGMASGELLKKYTNLEYTIKNESNPEILNFFYQFYNRGFINLYTGRLDLWLQYLVRLVKQKLRTIRQLLSFRQASANKET